MSWQPHFSHVHAHVSQTSPFPTLVFHIHTFHISIRNFHMLIHIFCTVGFVVTFFVTHCCPCFHNFMCSWIVEGSKNRHLILGLVWQASRATPFTSWCFCQYHHQESLNPKPQTPEPLSRKIIRRNRFRTQVSRSCPHVFSI